MDIPELQAQLDSVLNIKQKYEALKEEYYRISKEKEFQKVEASIYEVDDDIQKLEVSLTHTHKTSINKLKSIKIQNETDNYINNEHSKRPLIKLPKIPLPYFSGKIEERSLFKTQFNSIISENAELSENEKLYYLGGSLKGEAKIVETADDTFHSLFKALEQRYENKRLMVYCHIKNILNIQPLKHESGKDLRNVLDTILKNLRSLKILEFERDKLSDALLLNIILDKLDRDSRKQYELTLKDDNVPEFDDFLEILEARQVKLAADPSFRILQKIDVLLGAELFFSFLNNDKIKIAENLFLQSSVFGYLVSEEVETTEVYSDELKYCNDHFEKTHLRKPDGKFVVEMPFKPDSSEGILGNSKAIASKRLDQLWTRLERDPASQTLYSEFLNEYELLQHMEEVKEDSDVENRYYLPHHGVLRLLSKTTRLRVVVNASAKTSSGLSLNDLLCKGGVIQEDLFSILIRFRKYAYEFTADIRQMFRMIEVNPSQTKLQKIIWKNSKTAPTKVYELKIVPYRTASAPYLATRVLQQLALDEKKDFPLASEVLLQDFYMDDCLSGASELSEFEKLKSELTQILQREGKTLHKWCSNKAPSTELREFLLDRSSEEVMVKTLGMLWDSSGNSFTYKVTTSTDCNYTKRDVLSQIARIYDPLGLLGPVIAKAKIFMQQLWLLKLDWNETLPPDVSTQWRNFIQTLKDIESIHVPRCFLVVPKKFVVLNGFADASSKAYGAVIYVQTNEATNQLLCSKSRLAPIKSMTIPRLELCSYLLLAKLIH
ncbi:integrase catalytic domain-containing protein [Trichonephila clavipes]|nr:integrase catalytic domain-containing protein [Trichonephila clavipes]